MKKNPLLSFSAVLCAVVLVLSGCEVLSNPDKGTETYTVTFNANAGADSVTSLPAALTGISSGSKITAPAGNPVRNGYYFGGWYKESSCTTKWNFDSDTVSSSLSLYASWTTYTVTFDANAGTDTVTSLPASLTDIVSGSKLAKPSERPVRSGYYFGGWYTESGAVTAWDFSNDTVTSSVTLYASWLSVADYCCIQFDTGASGWVCEPIIAKKGSAVKLKTYSMLQSVAYSSTDPDFAVSNMYTDSSYENRYTGGDTYTASESTTFYFKMIRLYAVTIYPNGGKFSDSSTTAKTVKMTEGESLSSIGEYNAKPTREGYVFSCWGNDAVGTMKIPDTIKIVSSLTLFAQWAKLDTSMNGWWLYTNTNGNNCFMKLDTQSGSGVIYDDSLAYGLKQVTVTDTKITVGSDSYPYTYTSASGELTFSSIVCVRPSEPKTAGGNDSGTYYVTGSLLSLNTDNTCTLTSTKNTTVSVSGKWCRDGSSLCLLDDDANLVITLSGEKKLDYDTLGGHYYNYSGTESCGSKDAYSLYLDTDGTYHFYVFNLDIQGTWYASTSGTESVVYLSGGYGNSYESSMVYDGTSYTTSGGTKNTLTQASAKGSVSGFTEDPSLTGTWTFSQSGMTEEFTFLSDGKARLYLNMGSTEQILDNYYFVDKDKGFIYEISNTMPYMLYGNNGSSGSAYEYAVSADGTVLTLSYAGQSAVLTKK
jgi:uncharacterized repeat protein (TIGR02543 family)